MNPNEKNKQVKFKTYSIITLGCQMNHSDSERIAAVLEWAGLHEAPKNEIADVYVINTCSVRQKAEDKVFGMSSKFENIKKQNPDTKVIITGCMVKRDTRSHDRAFYQMKYEKELNSKLYWADFLLPISQIHQITELLGINIGIKIDEYLSITPKYKSNFQAFIPISTGCNKFCTFCIVPFTRGEEKHRPFHEIYQEVHKLVKNGYKEITLLGQNVNSWRSSTHGHLKVPIPKFRNPNLIEKSFLSFHNLLEELALIDEEFWLRFTSSHPYDINIELIDVMAKYTNIAKQLHFALQSGSNTILKRMNRHYTVEEFKEKVNLIRQKIPDIAITTDIIVGFCGETEKEFEETLKVCEEIKFDQIYISEYSQRPGTIASKFYKDDVPKTQKKLRKKILEEALKKYALQNNTKHVGKIEKVLISEIIHDDKQTRIISKNSQGKNVITNLEKNDKNKMPKEGEFKYARIQQAREFELIGELLP